ncbi:hypothetical protein TNCV_677801 [Trichonephila clavipes]|nr:hypothetical protein TNCV_677801 [Trichonephila clavipes]
MAKSGCARLQRRGNLSGVWSPRTAKTAAQLFCHGCDEVIDQTLGNTVSNPQEVQSPSLDSSRRPWSRSNARRRACPKHARLIQIRRARWQFHTLYCFSFKHVLHQTSSMRSALSSWKTKESPMAPA